MIWIDYVLLGLLIAGAVAGLWKGFVKEAFSLLALLLGLMAGFALMDSVGKAMAKNFDIKSEYWPFIAFLVVLIVVLVGVNLLGKFLDKVVKLALLGIPNRIAGGIFGAIRAAYSSSVLLWLLNQIRVFPPDLKAKSILLSPLTNLAANTFHWIGYLFPPVGKIFPAMEQFFVSLTPLWSSS